MVKLDILTHKMLDIAIRRRGEAGEDLSIDEVVAVFDEIIAGRCSEDAIASWLVALNRKGPSVSEVAGAALALRQRMTPIRSSRSGLLDTCGTGGDRAAHRRFNISTRRRKQLVTAAAGLPCGQARQSRSQ